MKKLLLLLGLLVTLTASAQNYTTVAVTNGPQSVLTNAAKLTQIMVMSTNATTLTFYDNGTTNITATNGIYTSVSSYSTNYTVTVTNSLGNLQTNSYSGIYTYTNLVAAATNNLPISAVIYTAPNVPYVLPITLFLERGLNVIANSNATVTAVWRTVQF